MKHKFIIIGSVAIAAVLIGALLLSAEQEDSKKNKEVITKTQKELASGKTDSKPQSDSVSAIPDNMVWNEEKKEYYDGSIFTWDTNSKDYIPRKDIGPQ